jgi:probable HAF family extracellular repeat protein
LGRGSCAGNDLGTFGGLATQAYAVNARGQVVGSSSTADDEESHAVLWSFGGRL